MGARRYLAGSALPGDTFRGTGMSGAAHAAKGRAFVLQWLQRRFAWGFSEFKSETCVPDPALAPVSLTLARAGTCSSTCRCERAC